MLLLGDPFELPADGGDGIEYALRGQARKTPLGAPPLVVDDNVAGEAAEDGSQAPSVLSPRRMCRRKLLISVCETNLGAAAEQQGIDGRCVGFFQ